MATIKDIAELAGVSRGAVDKALHNRPGISKTTAEKILRIAAELGYEPAASSRSPHIGCVALSRGNPLYNDMLEGIRDAQRQLSDHDLTVSVIETGDSAAALDALKKLESKGCGGFCVCGATGGEFAEYVKKLAEHGLPLITIGSDLPESAAICHVGADHRKCGSTAAALLAAMSGGQKRLLIISGPLSVKMHMERVHGFSQTLKEKQPSSVLIGVYEALPGSELTYRDTLTTLRLRPEINCVFIDTPSVTSVCRAILDSGRSQNIRVVCCDGLRSARELIKSGVIDAAVSQEPHRQGQTALRMMYDYLRSGKSDKPKDFHAEIIIKIAENL